MSEEILCVTRRQIRSIVCLCEEFGVRSKVQNLPLRTMQKQKIAYERGNFVRYKATNPQHSMSM